MIGSHSFLFAIAYMIGITQYFIEGRHRMMVVRTISSTLWTVYLWAIGGYAGAAACAIATIGCFIQAAVPEDKLAKTLKLRLAGAGILAATAATVCARTAGDLLPLASVVIGRFVELQASQQRIRLGLSVCQILWIIYHYSQGYILLYCAENIALLINLWTCWRHEQRRKLELVLCK